ITPCCCCSTPTMMWSASACLRSPAGATGYACWIPTARSCARASSTTSTVPFCSPGARCCCCGWSAKKLNQAAGPQSERVTGAERCRPQAQSGMEVEKPMNNIHIGISGWRYVPWRGDFYPEGLLQRRELEYASRTVNSIEINGSFYALQTPARFSNWRDSTPDDFVFSVKAPRYITHVKRLRELDEPLANFFASGPLQLERKLGAFLWQFPPSFRYDPALFTELFEQLPRTFGEAVQCAARSPRFPAPEGLTTGAKTRLRHAVEIRHRSFMQEGFIELLRKHRIALVVADTAGKWPLVEELTADFMYLRLHGDKELYSSGYDDSALDDWARRIRAW